MRLSHCQLAVRQAFKRVQKHYIFDTFFLLSEFYLPIVCGKCNTSSTHNLSDTQWPWHAAVYIVLPPGHTASTQRPCGMAVSDQQGTSEESTFWYLACSGTLLTQHSILVTAHCVVDKVKQQPLDPAHVKVVVGMQYQTSKNRRKSLQYLRVNF